MTEFNDAVSANVGLLAAAFRYIFITRYPLLNSFTSNTHFQKANLLKETSGQVKLSKVEIT
jgi:hypothetical protein